MQNKKQPPSSPLPPFSPPLAAEPTLRVLMRRHGKLVREVAAKNRVPAADIEDVVQVVLLLLWRVLRRGDGVVQPEAWLTTVTKRVAWVQTHQNKRWEQAVRSAADPSQVEPEPTAEELYMAVQNVELVHAVAHALRPGEREVFVRYELNGEPMSEIATSLGVPLGTAYNRLRLARVSFKKEVERRERQEGSRRHERKLVLLWPFAFLQWGELGGAGPAGELPGAAFMARQAGGKVAGAASPWLPYAMVVLEVFLLFDGTLHPMHEPGEAMTIAAAGAGAAMTNGAAGTGTAPGPQRKPARDPATAPEGKPEADAKPPVPVRATASAARSAVPSPAPSLAQPPALPPAAPSLLLGKRRRSLEAARILLDTADRMASEGRQNAVDEALRAYAAHAPDDPFPATRAALGPVGGKTPGAE